MTKYKLVVIRADFVIGAKENRWCFPFQADDRRQAQGQLGIILSRDNMAGPSRIIVHNSAPGNFACFVFRQGESGILSIDVDLSSLAIALAVDLCRPN